MNALEEIDRILAERKADASEMPVAFALGRERFDELMEACDALCGYATQGPAGNMISGVRVFHSHLLPPNVVWPIYQQDMGGKEIKIDFPAADPREPGE